MHKKLTALFVFLTTLFSPMSGVVVAFAQTSSSTPPNETPVQTINATPIGYKGTKKADFEKAPAPLSSSELQKLISAGGNQSGPSVTISNIGGNSVTEISIEDLVLDSKDYRSGATVTGTATIKSRSNADQTDIYLDTSLVGDYGTEQGRIGIPSVIYDTKTSGPFTVKANSVTKIPVLYAMPKKVGGKGLGIEVSARTISGLPYGWKDVHLSEVKGGSDLLNLQYAYIDVDGEDHYIQSGPTIGATSSVSFHLIVNNPSSKPITTIPSVQVRNRTSAGDLIKEYKLEPVTVPAKANKEIIIEPYKNNNVPGVYLAVVNLLDSSNDQILPTVEYRYIMPGAIATIQDVLLDKRSVAKDDTVTANVVFSGSPFDINTGARTAISNATINVKVLNAENDEIIGEGSASPDMNVQISEVNIPIQVKGEAQSIKTIATITADGKTLATYKTSATTPEQVPSKESSKDLASTTTQLVLWLMLAGIVLVTIFYFARSKGFGNGYFISILILIAVIIGGFAYVKYADSATKVYGSYTKCNYGYVWVLYPPPWGWGWYLQPPGVCTTEAFHPTSSVEQTQPARVHITKGENIPVQGIVRSANCSNSGEDLKIWVYLQDTSGTVRSAVQYYRWYYDNCSAYWRATGQHQPGCGGANNASAFSFTLPTTGLPSGDYNVVVHTYDVWGNNNWWESRADEYYTTAIHVYDPATTSCVADKTTANVGETVTWTASSTKGSGSYSYRWSEAGNASDMDQFPQTSSITRTYSAPGSKSMSSRLIDSLTTQDTGFAVCSNTVDVVGTTTPLTATCSVSATNVAIGQEVVWSLAASGGYTPYTYNWYENSNELTQHTSSITRTYSQAGDYSMAYRVDDSRPINPLLGEITLHSTQCTQTVHVSSTVCTDCGAVPAPTITGPDSGIINTNYTFNAVSNITTASLNKKSQTAAVSNAILAQATPQLKYGFDWNRDGTVDEWKPASGYVNAGVSVSSVHSWPAVGSYTFQVKAVNDQGVSSAWSTKTITIGLVPPEPAPEPIIARIPGQIIITFDKPLDPASVPPTTSVIVTTGDPAVNPTSVPIVDIKIAGPVLTLTTGLPVAGVDALSLTYIPPANNPLQGLTGSDVRRFNLNFKDTDVINIHHTNEPPVTIVSFGMRPSIVNRDSPCGMYLKVQNASSCTLTGTNVNPSGSNHNLLNVSLYNEGNASTTLNSGAIQETTRFTLTCKGQAKDENDNYGPTVSRSAQCFLNPASTEQ